MEVPDMVLQQGGGDTIERISIEVAWAEPRRQWMRTLTVPKGTTAREAVVSSGIDGDWPEVDVQRVPLGVFSRRLDGKLLPTAEEYEVRSGDRVEIYRPLEIDPMQLRRQRAARR